MSFSGAPQTLVTCLVVCVSQGPWCHLLMSLRTTVRAWEIHSRCVCLGPAPGTAAVAASLLVRRGAGGQWGLAPGPNPATSLACTGRRSGRVLIIIGAQQPTAYATPAVWGLNSRPQWNQQLVRPRVKLACRQLERMKAGTLQWCSVKLGDLTLLTPPCKGDSSAPSTPFHP